MQMFTAAIVWVFKKITYTALMVDAQHQMICSRPFPRGGDTGALMSLWTNSWLTEITIFNSVKVAGLVPF